jgi:alpha-tubulin suppressor-like RCC1 family protein
MRRASVACALSLGRALSLALASVTSVAAVAAVAAVVCATAAQAQATRRLPIISGMMGINVLVEVDGAVKSWGVSPAADGGFYGDGTDNAVARKLPAPIAGVHDIIDASVGYDHALLLQADGTVLGWGRNNGCSLGLPDEHRRYAPVAIPGLRDVRQVAAGMQFSAAVMNDGTVRVWGRGDGGLLANGKSGYETPCATAPAPVEGLAGVKRIVVTESDVLVLKQDGTVWGWGRNGSGILCDGSTERRTRPVQAQGIANAVEIAMGANTAIVLADGSVWMCGANLDGSMADVPKGRTYSAPVKVPAIASAVAVRTAAGSTTVRLKDGTLLGWGSGMFGSLGDGFIDKVTPKPHAPIGVGPVLAHFYASNSAYAIKADGTVMAWGIYVGGPKEWQLTPIPWFKVTLPD